MSDWGGIGPAEFGGYPVELEFSLASYVPRWAFATLRHRSGWLAGAEVEMETAFDRTRETIAAVIDEDGEPMGQWIAEALFSMRCGMPVDLSETPPEELDIALDALYWDFLGRCDLNHLSMLEVKERSAALMTSRLEARRQSRYDAAESRILKLNAQRRRAADAMHRAAIDREISSEEERQSLIDKEHREALAVVARDLQVFDDEVIESLRNHGSLARRYAVHWIVQPSLRDQQEQVFMPQIYSPRVHISDSREADSGYFTRDLVAASRNPKVRDRRVRGRLPAPTVSQDAIEDQGKAGPLIWHKTSKEEKTTKDRAAMDVLYAKWREADATKLERDKKLREQVAEINRQRAMERNRAAQQEVDALKPNDGDPAFIGVRPAEAGARGVERAFEQAAELALAPAAQRALVVSRHGGPESESELTGQVVEPMEPESNANPGNRSGDARVGAQASLESAADPSCNRIETALSDSCASAPVGSIPNPEPTPMPPELLPLRSYVVAGDCVQLRLKGDAGYVRYTFKGDVNVPRRSIIAIGDPRAKALLGRNIGDQVAFEIAGRDRLVVIEKIVVAAVTARTSTHAGMVGCATRTYRCG